MSTQTSITENLVVEIRRTFPVPRERLFNAWTDPREARLWFGGEGCKIRDFQMDARVGGKYSISVDSCEGGLMQVVGEYREVVPPSRLVYTWRWEDDPAWAGIDSLITVEFLEVAEGTELHMVHERFPSEESRGNHERGWNNCLDKLARLLEN